MARDEQGKLRQLTREPLWDGDHVSGLGINVVLATALAHGGGLLVSSECGEGARFTIVLPKDR